MRRPFWKAKIEKNRRRDRLTSRRLRALGFVVIRFWEHTLQDDTVACVRRIERLLSLE